MNLLMEYQNTAMILASIGALVVFVVGLFSTYVLWHIVRGFFIACSYIRWSLKVMKANGRKPKWPKFFPTFFSAWLRHIGHDDSLTISSGASTFRGWGNYTVVKQGVFVDTPDVHYDYELEDDDELEDDLSDIPDIDEIPANVRASRNVQFEPIKNHWPRSTKSKKR